MIEVFLNSKEPRFDIGTIWLKSFDERNVFYSLYDMYEDNLGYITEIWLEGKDE